MSTDLTLASNITTSALETIKQRRDLVITLYKSLMVEGTHYGVIPGTQKQTLLKPGAELICQLLALTAHYSVEETNTGNHREFKVKCALFYQGLPIAEAYGSCSTMESKYRYRTADRTCPSCGKETIRKSTQKDPGSWYCWAKIGGCGKQFPKGSPEIEQQIAGKIDNPDIADQYNTVLQMAQKRSFIAATRIASATSDMWTQDVEDMPEYMQAQMIKVVDVRPLNKEEVAQVIAGQFDPTKRQTLKAVKPDKNAKVVFNTNDTTDSGTKMRTPHQVDMEGDVNDFNIADYVLTCDTSAHKGKKLAEIPFSWCEKVLKDNTLAANLPQIDLDKIVAYVAARRGI